VSVEQPATMSASSGLVNRLRVEFNSNCYKNLNSPNNKRAGFVSQFLPV
jgi:hypothetical protein